MTEHFDVYSAFIEVEGVFGTFEQAVEAVTASEHTQGLTAVRMCLLHSTGSLGATAEGISQGNHEVVEASVQPYLVTVAQEVSGEVFLMKYVITFAEVVDAGRDSEDGSVQGGDAGFGGGSVELPRGVGGEEPVAPGGFVSSPGAADSSEGAA